MARCDASVTWRRVGSDHPQAYTRGSVKEISSCGGITLGLYFAVGLKEFHLVAGSL